MHVGLMAEYLTALELSHGTRKGNMRNWELEMRLYISQCIYGL